MIGVGSCSLGTNAEKYVMEALANRRLSYGPFLQKFEEVMSRAHGVRFAVTSNSGTSSLQVALQALKERHGWKDGDEVIVPAVTFVATSNIVLHNRMTPVFVDVEPDYYSLDPALLERAITARTRAVIPVHLFGQPADMDPIMEISRSRGLAVIEDSCETMFARYKGKSVGSFGDASAFSTYIAHLISTGVGGLTLTDDPDLAVRVRSLVNHGRDSIYVSIDDSADKTGADLRMLIAKRFSFVTIGHSFRVTELEGALGLAQFEDAEKQIAARRANAARLTEGLKPLEDMLKLPAIRPGSEHSFMMYPIVLRQDNKDQVTYELEQLGIETRDMLPIVNQPVYRDRFGVREENYPNAREINTRGFYIGCHPEIGESDLEHIIASIHEIMKQPAARPAAAKRSALILLSHNDASSAERVLERLPKEVFDEVVAVDAGSADETPAILQRKGIRVVRSPSGDAGAQAFAGVNAVNAEFIVMMLINGTHDPSDAERLLFQLKRGADVVIASRYLPESRRSDHDHRLTFRGAGNRFLSLVLNQRLNCNLTDPYSMFRGFRKGFFPERPPQAPGTTLGWALTLHAIYADAKISEVSTWEGPLHGKRSSLSLAVNGARALKLMRKQASAARKTRP